jgi:hypothetical protein
MYFALGHFPNLNSTKLDSFRKKYDPYFDKIEDHITVMHPVPVKVGKDRLVYHIQNILNSWEPFDVRIHGLEKTFDHWLLLMVQEGGEKITQLRNELYAGWLSPWLREDLEFSPHLGLGLFAEKSYDPLDPKALHMDMEKYNEAYRKAIELDFDFRCRVDKLTLIEVNDKATEFKKDIEFII